MQTAMSTSLPPPNLWLVQRLRKAALGFGLAANIALLAFVDTIWRERNPALYEAIEFAGAVLIFVCIFGRTWCTLYIGGRKKGEIVDAGPYSVVRNPLYVFTLIGALGCGMQTGSMILALLAVAITALVFMVVVRQEETYLALTFPEAFTAYKIRVPRFLPNFRLWRDVEELTVRPDLVRRTFFDALLFLLAIPIADLIEQAQMAGWLPVLAKLA